MIGEKTKTAMIALVPPPDVADELSSLPGATEPPEKLHCTLVIFPMPDDEVSAVQRLKIWARSKPQLTASLSGFGTFYSKDGYVFYAGVDCPGITRLRESLADLLELEGYTEKADLTHGYTPHVTLDYADDPVLSLPKMPKGLIGREFEVRAVFGDGDDFTYLPTHDESGDHSMLDYADWDESNHPRWPKGTGDKAGEFRSVRYGRFSVRGFKDATDEDKKRLSIPPAWAEVQVDRSNDARLLAVGTDGKGREQRIYSAKHHEDQAAAKFAKIKEIHDRMPEIDKTLLKDSKTDDAALAALLIRRMGLRPGSNTDTKAEKRAHGATTLNANHVDVDGDTVRLRFTGKKGMDLDLSATDGELASRLRDRLKDKEPNEPLLDTSDTKLREYLRDSVGDVRPKDFRTYLGTATAFDLVKKMGTPDTKKQYQKQRKEVGQQVADLLGNTPTVALASYIAPAVFGPWDSALGGTR